MYTILVKNDDTLIATNKETIMHRSSLVRKLRFLVDPTLVIGNETLNMTDLVCLLEYVLPISKNYKPVILTPSEELYKEKVEYVLEVDTKLTSEVGDVQLKLMWTKPQMLANGNFKDCVRKTSSTTITVLPVEQWSDYIADSNLDSIAQMILANQAQTEQLKLYADYLMTTKADSIKYNKETNELTLMGDSKKLDSVVLEESNCDCEEGVPVVDFSVIEPDEIPPELNNVIEF
jgi:hypothetical protein